MKINYPVKNAGHLLPDDQAWQNRFNTWPSQYQSEHILIPFIHNILKIDFQYCYVINVSMYWQHLDFHARPAGALMRQRSKFCSETFFLFWGRRNEPGDIFITPFDQQQTDYDYIRFLYPILTVFLPISMHGPQTSEPPCWVRSAF